MDSDADYPPLDRNSHVRPHIWRADKLAKESKFTDAVAEYDFIIEHGIDLPPDFYAQRGYFKFRNEDFPGCISDCTIALTNKPGLAIALHNRAAAYKKSGRNEEALADLEVLLEIEPKHALGLYLRAFILGDIGQWTHAIAAWEPYIELEPQDWRPRLFRGIAFAESGLKREAIQEYLKGTELKPQFTSFYFRRWILYRELNEPELAQRDFEQGKALLTQEESNPVDHNFES